MQLCCCHADLEISEEGDLIDRKTGKVGGHTFQRTVQTHFYNMIGTLQSECRAI